VTVTHEPGPFDAIYAEALNAAEARDLQRAVGLYDRAIAVDPNHPEAYYKRGGALKDLGRLDAALASYEQAIRLKPDYAHALCNRGVVQHRLGLLSAALSSYDRAIVLEPRDVLAHYNRALVLQDLSRWEEALTSYDHALAVNSAYPDAQYNRALTQLLLGDFERGWQGYEWRWKNAQRLSIGAARNFEQPLWLGDESVINGKRLLLWSEGGLGDTIQFCRYATRVARLGANVVLEVPIELHALLRSLEGPALVLARGTPLPEFDCHCPLMSLPLAFKTTLNTIPAERAYLCAPSEKVAQWGARMGAASKPRIGLVWAGNPQVGHRNGNRIDRQRSIDFDYLTPLLASTDCQFYSLQKGNSALAQLRCSPWRRLVVDWTDDLHDFADTAALVANLDLVITVDTAVAHLAGALGKPFWLINRFNTCWRWLRDREDSPWYPTARLFRQDHTRAWDDVIARIQKAVAEFARCS
jgi:hypothetical protein